MHRIKLLALVLLARLLCAVGEHYWFYRGSGWRSYEVCVWPGCGKVRNEKVLLPAGYEWRWERKAG